MKELIVATAVSMSSLDFLESIINPARVEAGEKPVRPSDFHARVNDEIDEKLNYENFVVGKTGHKTYYTTFFGISVESALWGDGIIPGTDTK